MLTVDELIAKLQEIPVEDRSKRVVFYADEDGEQDDLNEFFPVVGVDADPMFSGTIYLQNYPTNRG